MSLRYPLSVKDINDLSHRNHIKAAVLKHIQRRRARGLQRIIMAVACALEFPLLFTDIGSCNHSPYSPLLPQGQLTGNLTASVQFLKIEGFLISADLQHRIRRRIDDHMTCGNLLLSKLVNDCRSAGALISDNLMPCPAL